MEQNCKYTILQEDLMRMAHSEAIQSLPMGSCVFVTGATGLLGSQIVKALLLSRRQFRVVALVRSLPKAERVFSAFLADPGLVLLQGDVTEQITYAESVDYIIHGASVTSSQYFVEKPVETVFTALQGTRNVLDFARKKQVKKMVYLSSLEVYGIPSAQDKSVCETDYGYLDPMQVRSSYSEGKRMAECLCVAYAKEYGVPVCVARLSQTFGAGVAYDDGRVFAQFARCAIEGKDIVLHTQGKTARSYCYTTDAILALIVLLCNGKSGEAYNVTNMETMITVRDMAQMVCDLVPEKKIRVRIQEPDNIGQFGYNPEMRILLNSTKLAELGWKPQIGLKEMLCRLIVGMQSA